MDSYLKYKLDTFKPIHWTNMIAYFLILTCFLNIATTNVYNEADFKKMFNFYKQKYNRVYKNKQDEQQGLMNFIRNINKIEYLNKNALDNGTVYTMNKYSDLDSDDVKQHYAITVKPFINMRNHEEANALRNKKQNDLDATKLYDLDKAEDLYDDYKKRYKKNYTKKHDRLLHYYRFVKTLVAINKARFEGNYNVTLDENADILKEPNEYFYTYYVFVDYYSYVKTNEFNVTDLLNNLLRNVCGRCSRKEL